MGRGLEIIGVRGDGTWYSMCRRSGDASPVDVYAGVGVCVSVVSGVSVVFCAVCVVCVVDEVCAVCSLSRTCCIHSCTLAGSPPRKFYIKSEVHLILQLQIKRNLPAIAQVKLELTFL